MMKNKMMITNKFKSINVDVISSASDSSEEIEEGSQFLKGSTIVSLWRTIVNRVDK